VRIMFNGAEPISIGLCAEFTDRMSAFGLRPSAMLPVYGLAEATVAVSFAEVGKGAQSVHVMRASVAPGQPVEYALPDAAGSVPFVCLGQAVPGCELRIAGDDGSTLPDGTVGHVEIRGRNVTAGYYRNEEATRAAIRSDGWLDTGDLGFLGKAGLVITGRHKDIIFSNGQNFFPHDLESILQRETGLEMGKVAVAGYRAPDAEADDLLVFIVQKGDLGPFLPLAGAVTATLNAQMGIDVAHVVPIGRIPKTTSGKAQRARLVQDFVDGEFAPKLAQLDALRAESIVDEGGATDGGGGADASIANRLLDLCRGLLPARTVNLTDNLFEIGTSSLELAQIHEGIDKAFPGVVDITDLFDYPTIAELAAFLEAKLGVS
jgi:acyl-CoA synthetase (AMP-forming)/AMP-acid ligase II